MNDQDQTHAEHQYLDGLRRLLGAPFKADRTGTGTHALFGNMMTFDLSGGFPLLTTKRVHTKSITHELLWIIAGDTNVRYLQENKVTIWDEWRRPYSLDREIEFVTPRLAEPTPYDGDFSAAGAYTDSDLSSLAGTWVRMMRRCYDPSHDKFRFYGAKGTTVHKDWHDVANFIKDAQSLPHAWYRQNDPSQFELDKDYYGSNQYGPQTCVWLRTDENNIYTKSAKPIEITDSEGSRSFFISLNEAARKTGIPSSTLSRFLKDGIPSILKGRNKSYLGWEFNEADLQGKLPRLRLIENGDLGRVYGAQWRNWRGPDGQIVDQLLEAQRLIRSNPDSRRIIINAWNPGESAKMALTPCHAMVQFQVSEGRLNCILYQRSADWFLGVPFNIASYAMLTHMMAQTCGLKPGAFTHMFGDWHLYVNHVDQAREQLSREPRPFPSIKLNPDVRDITDFRFEDIQIEGYDPHPAIKAEVSV